MQQRFYKDFNVSNAFKGTIKSKGTDRDAVVEDLQEELKKWGRIRGKNRV